MLIVHSLNALVILLVPSRSDTNDLVDRHTPQESCTFLKGPAKWLSDSCLLEKAVRSQFKHIWRKDKSLQNLARVHKQIAYCNSLVDKGKSNYYINFSVKVVRIQRNSSRSYILHCILFPKQYSLLMSLRKVLLATV